MNASYIGARVSPEMRRKFLSLGGVRWLRAQLDDPAAKPVLREVRAQNHAKMAEMYAAGEKMEYIMAVCECSYNTVLVAVDRAGIPRRSKGRPANGGVA